MKKIIFLMSFACTINIFSMDNNANLQVLFQAITDYKYEVSACLIKQNPELVDMVGKYRKNEYISTPSTPVHVAALQGNDVALAQLLAVSKKSVNTPIGWCKDTPLCVARNKRVAQLLIHNGAIADSKDEYGDSILLNLLEKGSLYDVADCLVTHGANVNQLTRFGDTLLYEFSRKDAGNDRARFLLKRGANPDLPGNDNETAFDNVQQHEDQRELFCEFGFVSYYETSQLMEFFKSDPKKFLESKGGSEDFYWNGAFRTIVQLYRIAKQQERGLYTFLRGPNSSAITIKEKKYSKIYIFKRPSFADLENFFGKEAIDCLKSYCEEIFDKVKKAIEAGEDIPDCVPRSMYNVMDVVDASGNSLLHIAAKAENVKVIKELMYSEVDCIVINNEGKIAFDYLKNSKNTESIWAFIGPLINRFFRNNLDKKTEKFVLNEILLWNRLCITDRMHYFFKSLLKRPDKVEFFLKKGIDVNYKDERGITSLNFMLSEPWERMLSDQRYVVRLLLDYDAIVTQEMIEESSGYTKELLQMYYDKQECCVCYEHPENLSKIPCNNKHSEFLCKGCYTGLAKKCPICRKQLGDLPI